MNESRLPQLLAGAVNERGGVALSYTRKPEGIEVTARKDAESATLLLDWAFGSGAQGITPVGRLNGEYIEHRVSWYARPARPALTTGHSSTPSLDAVSALGLRQSPETIFRCFNCHATNVKRTVLGPDLSAMRVGVQCERCHGPGLAHSTKPSKVNVLNPGNFPATAIVQLCGECHRSPTAAFQSEMPELDDPLSIRFQPVGLMASRCIKEGKTLSCVTCHDPHENASPATDASYSSVCMGCHEIKAPAKSQCRRAAKENCIPCHMEARSPALHLRFTDHRIRIY
jgi:predicted CXXCH cytochrome family protein